MSTFARLTSPLSLRHKTLRNRIVFVWIPILIVTLGLVTASALLGFWILRPIRTISRTTQALGADNLDQRVPGSITRRNDAFGDLGRELNRMTERVQSTIESQHQLLRDV